MMLKRLLLCFGAMALVSSAMAQNCPPKGYNSTLGDFNGDGKKEYVYFIPPKDADRWDELSDLSVLNGVLKFTDPSIPDIFLKFCVTGVPNNLGDLNGDGKDEIGIQPGWVTSSWGEYRVFTLKSSGWIDAISPIAVYLDDDLDFDTTPPIKKLGKGKVRITNFQWGNGGVQKNYKVVRIK